jgi:hypothetical protein
VVTEVNFCLCGLSFIPKTETSFTGNRISVTFHRIGGVPKRLPDIPVGEAAGSVRRARR